MIEYADKVFCSLSRRLIYSLLNAFIYFSWIVNRRLDEWVKLEQLDLDSVETVVDEKVEDKVIYIFTHLLFYTWETLANVLYMLL